MGHFRKTSGIVLLFLSEHLVLAHIILRLCYFYLVVLLTSLNTFSRLLFTVSPIYSACAMYVGTPSHKVMGGGGGGEGTIHNTPSLVRLLYA